MISRSYAWINDAVEHDEHDKARATALARRWSQMKNEEERRMYDRMARIEDGREDREEGCGDEDECTFCSDGDYYNCPQEVAYRARRAAAQAERDLEIELIEDKLAALGARMMRPYEHWNEDERYMEYMER